jgi:hypothetical protein
MTATAPVRAHPVRASRVLRLPAGRLLWLELRRNPMALILPLLLILFWFDTFRGAMALPAIWSSRALPLEQGSDVVDLAPFVAGVAAWVGSRDGRRGTGEQVTSTALPRWKARLIAWVAVTCWSMAGYLVCVGGLYAVTASQGAAGHPLWWPVVVGAFAMAAFSALGFAAGTLVPSRFTAPLAAITALLALFATFNSTSAYTLVSPMEPPHSIAAAAPDAGVFSSYLPDLSEVQILFLLGLVLAALGALGLADRYAGRLLRSAAVTVIVVGLAGAGTGIALAGTAKVQANGAAIPALHDAASDRAVSYKPACEQAAIPVCVNPVYRSYLPAISAALDPVLSQFAGLPGAPVRVTQVAFSSVNTHISAATLAGTPAVLSLSYNIGHQGSICNPQTGACVSWTTFWKTSAYVVSAVRPEAATAVLQNLVGDASAAQQAVSAGVLMAAGVPLTSPGSPQALAPAGSQYLGGTIVLGPARGSPVYSAAQRFAALSATARHTWLSAHLAALRAGQVTLVELP